MEEFIFNQIKKNHVNTVKLFKVVNKAKTKKILTIPLQNSPFN